MKKALKMHSETTGLPLPTGLKERIKQKTADMADSAKDTLAENAKAAAAAAASAAGAAASTAGKKAAELGVAAAKQAASMAMDGAKMAKDAIVGAAESEYAEDLKQKGKEKLDDAYEYTKDATAEKLEQAKSAGKSATEKAARFFFDSAGSAYLMFFFFSV